jgi:hypothetical protein
MRVLRVAAGAGVRGEMEEVAKVGVTEDTGSWARRLVRRARRVRSSVLRAVTAGELVELSRRGRTRVWGGDLLLVMMTLWGSFSCFSFWEFRAFAAA